MNPRGSTGLTVIGLGLCWVWSAFVSPLRADGPNGLVGTILACILAVALWRLMEDPRRLRCVLWTCAITGSTTSALMAAGMGTETTVAILSTLLEGVSRSFMMLMWAQLFALENMYRASIGLGIAYVATGGVYFALSPLPSSVIPGIAIALPLMIAALLELGLVHRGPVSLPKPRPTTMQAIQAIPWRMVLVIAIVSFAAGINRLQTTADADILAMGIVGLLILVSTALFARRFSIYYIYRVFLPLMMIGLLIGTFLGKDHVVAQYCINVSFAVSSAVFMLYICDKSRRFGFPILCMYAVGRLCTRLSFFAGTMLSTWFGAVSASGGWGPEPGIYAAAAFAIAMALIIWLSTGRNVVEEPEGLQAEKPAKATPPSTRASIPAPFVIEAEKADAPQSIEDTRALMGTIIDERCAALAEEYHLSAREKDVLELLAWGKNVRRIEEVLVLSTNTVKTHMRHIYTKLGIHTRAELDALLGIGEDRG